MPRKPTAVAASLAALAVLGTTSLAHAQSWEFGHRGGFIVSADRLVPIFSYARVSDDSLTPPPGTSQSTTTSQTALSFLWGAAASGSPATEQTFFTVPRIGFDYVLVPHLTVGGDIIVAFTLGSSASTETDTAASGRTTTTSSGAGGMFSFGLAPRAGYILRLTSLLSAWFRGGFSFYTQTVTSPKNPDGSFTHNSADQFALDLDPQLVILPVPHLGATVGPTLDIPLAGQRSVTTFNGMGGSTEQSAHASLLFFGITAGLIGYF